MHPSNHAGQPFIHPSSLLTTYPSIPQIIQPIYPAIRSFIHPFLHASMHPLNISIHLLIYPSVQPFVHPLIRPFINLSIRSSIHPTTSSHTQVGPLQEGLPPLFIYPFTHSSSYHQRSWIWAGREPRQSPSGCWPTSLRLLMHFTNIVESRFWEGRGPGQSCRFQVPRGSRPPAAQAPGFPGEPDPHSYGQKNAHKYCERQGKCRWALRKTTADPSVRGKVVKSSGTPAHVHENCAGNSYTSSSLPVFPSLALLPSLPPCLPQSPVSAQPKTTWNNLPTANLRMMICESAVSINIDV
jgi:hypothetical protein